MAWLGNFLFPSNKIQHPEHHEKYTQNKKKGKKNLQGLVCHLITSILKSLGVERKKDNNGKKK